MTLEELGSVKLHYRRRDQVPLRPRRPYAKYHDDPNEYHDDPNDYERVPLLPLPSPEYNYRLVNDYFLYFRYFPYDLEPPRNECFEGITPSRDPCDACLLCCMKCLPCVHRVRFVRCHVPRLPRHRLVGTR